MTVRKSIAISTLLVVCSCQQEVAVPTARELIDNRQLLTEWQNKCATGEYSHLSAEQKVRFCATTNDASISVAEAAAAKSASDFYGTNIKRK